MVPHEVEHELARAVAGLLHRAQAGLSIDLEGHEVRALRALVADHEGRYGRSFLLGDLPPWTEEDARRVTQREIELLREKRDAA